MRTQKIILNYILFQVGWFACVLGAANGLPWLAFFVVLILVLGQIYFAPNRKNELMLVGVACVLGAVIDQVLLTNHIVNYTANGWSVAIVPVWIIALWMSFSSTLNLSMRWLREQKILAFFFGLIGGPLAYLAAEKLGAIYIPPFTYHYAVLGVFWGFAMLALTAFAKQLDGYAHA